mmetsp:Transcript_972/g.3349  ORF Transcript_972/g.3349 Transcript_972/m.3349 type:complete len:1509 (-) Transcript_972:62-4588(-)|eukprot:CAMPEP_0117436332 /NCGR_PEP_ID=MMETSP0759-20121206/953_1 /TAXON_ID=63605 /ORGANISM="Percolomonas cosmopolitus, Strain WS" /LENGTH=1508 /DNA_ID=CAMNT_0005227929 /DNA_START=340 /DNA_END=4866 /DNA_ORIENTATION=+
MPPQSKSKKLQHSSSNIQKKLSVEDKFHIIRKHEKKINEQFKVSVLRDSVFRDLRASIRSVRALKEDFVAEDYTQKEFETLMENEYTQKVSDLLEKQYIFWQVQNGETRKATVPTFRLSEPPELKGKRIDGPKPEQDNESSESESTSGKFDSSSDEEESASGESFDSSSSDNNDEMPPTKKVSPHETVLKSRKRKAYTSQSPVSPASAVKEVKLPPPVAKSSQSESESDHDNRQANKMEIEPQQKFSGRFSPAADNASTFSSEGDEQKLVPSASPSLSTKAALAEDVANPVHAKPEDEEDSASDCTNPLSPTPAAAPITQRVKQEPDPHKEMDHSDTMEESSDSESRSSDVGDGKPLIPHDANTAKRSTLARALPTGEESSDDELSDVESLLEEEEIEDDFERDSFIITSEDEDDIDDMHGSEPSSDSDSFLSHPHKTRHKRKRSPSPSSPEIRPSKKPKRQEKEDALSVDMDAVSSSDVDSLPVHATAAKKESDSDSFISHKDNNTRSNPNKDFGNDTLSADEMDDAKVTAIRNSEIQSISDTSEDIPKIENKKKKSSTKKRQTKLFERKPKKPLDAAGRRKVLEREAKKLEELQKKRHKLLENAKAEDVAEEMRVVNPLAGDEDRVLIPLDLFRLLKPHQVEGIQFLWDRIWDKENNMRGAILAHSMGLGKTLQAVTFMHMSTANMKASHMLVICPKSVVENWKDEIYKWLGEDAPDIYMFESSDNDERKHDVDHFEETGGVFIISQNMLARLLSPNAKLPKYKDNLKSESYKELQLSCKKTFVETVNLCIVDEGHMISKEKNHLTQALATLKTRNRVVLTGTPLQNHLKEMYQLINWVRPNHWSQQFFNNFYANPIKEGMKKDSTKFSVTLMKRRSFLLIKKLKAFVDRKNVDILKQALPPKTELVIGCRMTDFQRDLYSSFINCSRGAANLSGQLFFMWHTVMKIVNHPDIVRSFMKKKSISPHSALHGAEHDYSWATPLFDTNYKTNDAERSTKLKMSLQIIESCINQNEKILVFSQFTDTLSLLEHVLGNTELSIHGRKKRLEKGKDWYRLDGSSSSKKRHSMVKNFNTRKDVSVFFISTKAGGMGINLTGATRILIYDVLWNPMWNSQALFRSYRYGQKKSVFVYRLCTVDCIEEVLWSRCTAKSWLFEKVVNDSNPTRSISFADLELQPSLDETDKRIFNDQDFKHDKVFCDAYEKMKRIIRDVYSYDSLYEEDLDDKLTEEERREAELEEEQMKDRERSVVFVDPIHKVNQLMDDRDDTAATTTAARPAAGHSVFMQELMSREFQRVAPANSRLVSSLSAPTQTTHIALPTDGSRGAHSSALGSSFYSNSGATPNHMSAYAESLGIPRANGNGKASEGGHGSRPETMSSRGSGGPSMRQVSRPQITQPQPLGERFGSVFRNDRSGFNQNISQGVMNRMASNAARQGTAIGTSPWNSLRLSQPHTPTVGHQKPPTRPHLARSTNMQDLVDQYNFASEREKRELLEKNPGLKAAVAKGGML